MKNSRIPARLLTMLLLLATAAMVTAGTSRAHCDTMSGPVVSDARTALDAGNLKPVLKWIKPAAEPEIRAAFQKTLAVRQGNPAARELADTWFFETLVRVHRAGEGAPYTGLKPAGSEVEPGIEEADHALESGSVEPLLAGLTAALEASVRESYERVSTAARQKDASPEAGREYVEAYVQFIHYVERLHEQVAGGAAAGDHHAAQEPSSEEHAD